MFVDQLRPVAIAAGLVSLAASLFAIGAAVSSDDDGGEAARSASVAPSSPETTAGEASGETGDPAATAAAASDGPAASHLDIEITNFAFGPAEATVTVGTEVVWTNNDGFDHSIVFEGNAFDPSPNLAQGDTFRVTFTEPGSYRYLCGIHPEMSATIVVEA